MNHDWWERKKAGNNFALLKEVKILPSKKKLKWPKLKKKKNGS